MLRSQDAYRSCEVKFSRPATSWNQALVLERHGMSRKINQVVATFLTHYMLPIRPLCTLTYWTHFREIIYLFCLLIFTIVSWNMLVFHTDGNWFSKCTLFEDLTCSITTRLNSPGKSWKIDINGPEKPWKTHINSLKVLENHFQCSVRNLISWPTEYMMAQKSKLFILSLSPEHVKKT